MLLFLELLQADANRWKYVLPLGAGLLPAAAYFVQNKLKFGAVMTVSSRAKQLTVGFHPTLLPLRTAFDHLLGAAYVYCLIGLLLLLIERDRSVRFKPLFIAAILFPWLQIAALCIISDWALEFWYSYSLVLACLITSILIARRFAQIERISLLPATTLAMCLLVVISYKKFHGQKHDSIGTAAVALATWSSAHPGTMAMGDRAGKVGWLLPGRLLQLEGLVEDESFLRRIRAQDDVIRVMKDYNVRYYVTAKAVLGNDHCYAIAEPSRTGEYAAKMHARLCAAPIFEFKDALLPGQRPDCCVGTVNDVFDLEPLMQDENHRWVDRSIPR